MLNSLFSAFLMYSRIPMPRVEWKEENRRYALGFFPLVGAVIGGLLMLWRMLCTFLDVDRLLFAAGAVFIPLLVTGGIHLDGFCDVSDAKASYASPARRLEIMSDPHIGAFAAIRLCVYLIIQAGLFSQVGSAETAAVVACGYVLSRALSGLSAVSFRSAKSEGTLHGFVRPSHRKLTVAMELFFIVVYLLVTSFVSLTAGLAGAAAAAVVFAYYRHCSYRDFGGTTGDLCGWFLQLCEIWLLAAAVFSERIVSVLK